MISCSRLVLGFLNVVALTFSIFQIICSLIYEHQSGNKKQYCYKSPSSRVILMISYFLLIMSLIGLLSSFCKSNNGLQLFYLWVVLISAIVAITATVFIFAVLPKGSPITTWQKAESQNGNWIDEFSPLIRTALVSDEKWVLIRSCLTHSGLCESFRDRSTNPIWEENLRFLELGCCIPPRRCGFVQKNETKWEIPKSGIIEKDMDMECKAWLKSKYCYDCDSCKAGYLSKFQRDWKAYKGIYIGLIVILVIATFLSCYSFNYEETRIKFKQGSSISSMSKPHDTDHRIV